MLQYIRVHHLLVCYSKLRYITYWYVTVHQGTSLIGMLQYIRVHHLLVCYSTSGYITYWYVTVHQGTSLTVSPVCRRSTPAQDDGNRRHRLPLSITCCISRATVSAGTAQTTRSPGQPSPSVRTAARGRTFKARI